MFVPNAPYNDKTLKIIFEFFIIQLKNGLTNEVSVYFPHYFHLLESLSIVQTPSLLIKLSNGIKIIEKFFYLFYKLCLSNVVQSNTLIQGHFIRILILFLTELDTIPAKLLDIMLETFVNEDRNPYAYELTKRIIIQAEQYLEHSIIYFFKSNLFKNIAKLDEDNSSDDNESDQPSTTTIGSIDNQLAILKSIALCKPNILLSILSPITDLMEHENDDIRLDVVSTICDILTYHDENGVLPISGSKIYDTLCNALLYRFDDRNVNIRLYLCEKVGILLFTQSKQQELIWKKVVKELKILMLIVDKLLLNHYVMLLYVMLRLLMKLS